MLVISGVLKCSDDGARKAYLQVKKITDTLALGDPDFDYRPHYSAARTGRGLLLYTEYIKDRERQQVVLSTPWGGIDLLQRGMRDWASVCSVIQKMKLNLLGFYRAREGVVKKLSWGERMLYSKTSLDNRFYEKAESGDENSKPVSKVADLHGEKGVLFDRDGHALAYVIRSINGDMCEKYRCIARMTKPEAMVKPKKIYGYTAEEQHGIYTIADMERAFGCCFVSKQWFRLNKGLAAGYDEERLLRDEELVSLRGEGSVRFEKLQRRRRERELAVVGGSEEKEDTRKELVPLFDDLGE